MDVVLACDLGGSSLKTALIRASGHVCAQYRKAQPVPQSHSGFSELDPHQWWHDLGQSLDALRAMDAQAFSRIQGIAMCGFTRTQVFIGRDGSVLRPAITWQDSRAETCAETLRALLPSEHPEWPQINAFHPLARLHWIKQHEPSLWDKLGAVLDPKDFIHFRLTGQLCSDPISLARLVAASHAGAGSHSLLASAGLSDHILPQLAHPVTQTGVVQKGLGAAFEALVGKPVFNCANDTWAAVLGLGAMRPGMAYNISGTTEVFGVLSHSKATADGLLHVDWGDIDQLGGPSQNGADTLRWLLSLLQDSSDQDLIDTSLEKLLAGPREAQPLLFLPYLNGERTPYWNPALRGALIGLNRKHSATDMAYAVMEGVSFHNRLILERAEAAMGLRVHEIRFGGGAAANPVWRQIKADICARPVRVTTSQEAGLLGTAAVIWTGLGRFSSLEAAQDALVQTASFVTPDPERVLFYDQLYQHFRAAEHALAPVSMSLAHLSSHPSPDQGKV